MVAGRRVHEMIAERPPKGAVTRTEGITMTTRRQLITTGALAGAAAIATPLAAPAVHAQGKKIKWRLQTYAGPALGAHVLKPPIDSSNRTPGHQTAHGRYYPDHLV